MSFDKWNEKVRSGEIKLNRDYLKTDEFRSAQSKRTFEYWAKVKSGEIKRDCEERRRRAIKESWKGAVERREKFSELYKRWWASLSPEEYEAHCKRRAEKQRETWKRKREEDALNKIWNELLNPII